MNIELRIKSHNRSSAKALRSVDRRHFNKCYWGTGFDRQFKVQLPARTMCRWMNARGYSTSSGLGMH